MEARKSYHLYNHANGSELLFREADNYRYFMEQYRLKVFPVIKTFAYCLMPNHFHLLVQSRNGEQSAEGPQSLELPEIVSKSFSNLFNTYAKAYNIRFGRRGSLFERPFKRELIESDEQWQNTFLYINLNPVKHRFVERPELWKWSSVSSYLHLDRPSSVDRLEAWRYFGDQTNLLHCMEKRRQEILDMEME